MIKKYEEGTPTKNEIKSNEDLYNINQVIEIYPLLSKHLLTNAINNGELKVTWIGNKRYFSLNDIDNYLKTKQEIVKNNAPNIIKSWRNYE